MRREAVESFIHGRRVAILTHRPGCHELSMHINIVSFHHDRRSGDCDLAIVPFKYGLTKHSTASFVPSLMSNVLHCPGMTLRRNGPECNKVKSASNAAAKAHLYVQIYDPAKLQTP